MATFTCFIHLYSVRFLLELLDKRVKGPKTSQKQWGFPIFDMGTPFFLGSPYFIIKNLEIAPAKNWDLSNHQQVGLQREKLEMQ
jgi:hypothetical protein